MNKKRCPCSMFCSNPPEVIIDFKDAFGGLGVKTKRLCLRRALAFLKGIEAERAEEARDKATQP
jgi:hypothetical protein